MNTTTPAPLTTSELLAVIGPFNGDTILSGRAGNGRTTTGGYLMADPCYIDPADDWPNTPIGSALRTEWPWDGYDYTAARAGWRPFNVRGVPCWARDTGGDGNFWGCNVDSGGLVVVPLALLAELSISATVTPCDPTYWPESTPNR